MNRVFQAAKEICAFMTERHWKFCLIGGLAVQRWGEPPTTMDVGFIVLTGIDREEEYIRGPAEAI